MAKAKYRVCQGYDDEWSWKLIAPNGKAIARGNYYYKTKSACLRAINATRKHAKTLVIQEEC